MAKGIEHFADNWQKASGSKDSYASKIHEQGEAARATVQLIEKAKLNGADAAGKLNDPAKAATEKPAQDVKDLPQGMQAARLETQGQAQAVKSRELAEQNYQSVRKEAQNLKNLEKNIKQPAGAETITKDAVSQRPQPNSADLGRNANPLMQQNLAHLAGKQVSKNAARDKIAEPQRPETKGAEKTLREGEAEKPAAQQKILPADGKDQPPAAFLAAEGARAAAAAGDKTDAAADIEKPREGEEEKGTDGGESSTSSVYTAKPGAGEKSRKLGALLSGFSGGSQDAGKGSADGKDTVAKVAADTKAGALPDSDPGFKVYSEFDSEVAGPHTVKAKAQVYSNMVEKKLRQIAKFDEDLGAKMKEMFATKPLSERIVGELKDELKSTSFLGSIYGGVIG